MDFIIQHNFNQGFGDAFLAMSDYLNHAKKLKSEGYKIKLIFWLYNNKYFKSESPLEYLDETIFSIFDEIEVSKIPLTQKKQNGYECVFTHAGAHPSSHYWDLYVKESLIGTNSYSNIKRYSIESLLMDENHNVIPKLNVDITKKCENFINDNKLNDFVSIHFRTQDLDNEPSFLEKKKQKIYEIIQNNEKVFVCSNSLEFIKFIRESKFENVYYFNLPEWDSIGGHHMNQIHLSDDILKQRNVVTLSEMFLIGESKKVYAISSFNRLSYFLFFSAYNKRNIIPIR